jgi:xanthine dehydrogenase small subunit
MRRANQRRENTMRHSVSFVLDGRLQTVEFGGQSGLTPTTTVLNFLRGMPGHQGTKEGCAEGDCGACTVVLAERDGQGLRYDAVDSCLLFLPMLHGRQLITVENLRTAGGMLHPVQQSMVDHHGSQCGFCTPGIVMSLFALSRRAAVPSVPEIRTALAGNLCRCTGYRPIIDAASVSPSPETPDPFQQDEPRILDLLGEIPDDGVSISSGEQVYLRPSTLEQGLHFRAAYPQAVIVNGATDVALRVTKSHQLLPAILDLSGVGELGHMTSDDRGIALGAGVTIARMRDWCAHRLPTLTGFADLFGSEQIRAMATIGGNIGTASPVGDALPVLIAHDGEIILTGPRGIRSVPAAEFVVGYRRTACAPDELITGVRVPPVAADTVIRWYKVSRRRDVDIATVSAAFRLERDGEGHVRRTVLAYGGMADRTARAARTEAFLAGKSWIRPVVQEAARLVETDFQPLSDVRGSAEFRRVAARNLLLKFWTETGREAGGVNP